MGILKRLGGGRLVLIEGAGPVRETPLQEWVDRGCFGRITIKRFEGIDGVKSQKIFQAARSYYGRPYDLFFLMEEKSIYCSQLVYLAFQKGLGEEVGVLQTFKDLDLDNWTVEKLMESRWQRHPLCVNSHAKLSH
ncbi:MAG: hypothetical protein GY915_05150 [bacterium]|nr:hypothetical protein [bacterium]